MFYAYTLVFLLLLQEVLVLFKQLKPTKVGFTTEKITFFPPCFSNNEEPSELVSDGFYLTCRLLVQLQSV